VAAVSAFTPWASRCSTLTAGFTPPCASKALAAFLWHFETGEPAVQTFDKPLLGIHNGTAYTLLYNASWATGDRRAATC